jgi:hypothetical protein
MYHLTNDAESIFRNPEDLADPQTKLSRHQIRDVQRSWESMRSGRNALISTIFIK